MLEKASLGPLSLMQSQNTRAKILETEGGAVKKEKWRASWLRAEEWWRGMSPSCRLRQSGLRPRQLPSWMLVQPRLSLLHASLGIVHLRGQIGDERVWLQ